MSALSLFISLSLQAQVVIFAGVLLSWRHWDHNQLNDGGTEVLALTSLAYRGLKLCNPIVKSIILGSDSNDLHICTFLNALLAIFVIHNFNKKTWTFEYLLLSFQLLNVLPTIYARLILRTHCFVHNYKVIKSLSFVISMFLFNQCGFLTYSWFVTVISV